MIYSRALQAGDIAARRDRAMIDGLYESDLASIRPCAQRAADGRPQHNGLALGCRATMCLLKPSPFQNASLMRCATIYADQTS